MMELAVGGFILTLFGFAFGVWKYIDSQIVNVRAELAAHKLHTAESYVTKAGMSEQTSAVMRAIEGVAKRIDGLNERLDRTYESRPGRRSN